MSIRVALLVIAVCLTGCGKPGSAPDGDSPQLEAPAPEAEPSRVFAASNDAARAASIELNLSRTLRLPDVSVPGADAQEFVTMRGANGLVLEAQVSSAVSPATQVQGQTLRALLDLPVEEAQTLVYRVTSETKTNSGRGICGAESTQFMILWEPSGPGESLKLLGLSGGAPGASGARACPMLEYQRG
jgi:hypothetical protein